MDAIAVPASQILQEWEAEMRIRAKLTPPELAARERQQRMVREREISRAFGRRYRIEEDC
ncbi:MULTISPECIES: hypothetical protein [Aeromonas]|jgi:hypothetical protein|uniref:hypothetical protein n=1 Tax=Aeromonas TaxID=642 RepID=UPI000DDA075B|nr:MULTISPECIES: hypothetical protein [Aeromonas]ELO1556396.1 hypothetical protein [Aeromonas hydrophila]QXW30876.1 hypothetical protein KXJ75_07410 [Aeromonas sanarellii]AXB03225.1 hypothetical protein C1C92_21295 [Aeromonas caviae]QQQ14392.1 hypothetical protein JJL53_04435 [Aeromonas media]GJA84677.1 hypothetical protein KAM356_07360 [Aeromonas caviae]